MLSRAPRPGPDAVAAARGRRSHPCLPARRGAVRGASGTGSEAGRCGRRCARRCSGAGPRATRGGTGGGGTRCRGDPGRAAGGAAAGRRGAPAGRWTEDLRRGAQGLLRGKQRAGGAASCTRSRVHAAARTRTTPGRSTSSRAASSTSASPTRARCTWRASPASAPTPTCCPKALEALQGPDRRAPRRGDDRRAGVRLARPGLPPRADVSDYAHYQQGLVDLRVGNERWANTHFAKLPETGARPAAPSSRCSSPGCGRQGAGRRGDDRRLPRAVQGREAHPWRRATRRAGGGPPALREEGLHGRARGLRHGAAARARPGPRHASTWRRRGPATSWASCARPWASSPRWTRPPSGTSSCPDKYLLRALIYRDLCHYLPAKRAAKELTRRFADSLEAMREREDLTQDARLRRAASSHGSHPARREVPRVRWSCEGERLGRYAGSFGDRLYKH